VTIAVSGDLHHVTTAP